MPVRFLLDEQMRGKPLWHALRRLQSSGSFAIDVIRVGDAPDLPLGTTDPDILIWSEREGRILISEGRRTITRHLAEHLRSGQTSPGIFVVRRGASLADVVRWLQLVAIDDDPGAWRDQATFIP